MSSPTVLTTAKIYDANGNYLCEFPQFQTFSIQDAFNNIGAFSLVYPLAAQNASQLISDSSLQLACLMDFGDGNGFGEVWRGLIEQDSFDVAAQESTMITCTGRSMVAILGQGIVYPQGGVGSTSTYQQFSGATPGNIMHTLITKAQARGCFPGLSMSFTSGADSSGNAWTQSYTYAYSAGTNLLDVLLGLAQGQLCDFSMTGITLNLYNPGTTLATNRQSTVILRRGRDIMSAPRSRDRTQIGTAVLCQGDNGVNVEVINSGQIAAIGRYEQFLSQSGVNDTGTLTYFGNLQLGAADDQQFSFVVTYIFNNLDNGSFPWRDYHPGDYISLDIDQVAGSLVGYRARQWAVTMSPGAPLLGQLTLNDVFYENEVILQGKMTDLTNGSVSGVSSVATLPGPNSTVPNAPTFLTSQLYTSAYYSPATGKTQAQLELNWSQPTNTDGTAIVDGYQYVVQYKVDVSPIFPIQWSQMQSHPWSNFIGNPWSNPLATPVSTAWTSIAVPFDQTACTISGLQCGQTYDLQIACMDVSGNTSVFSGTTSVHTATDNIAPSQPDAPQVSASMVAVQVMHDLGKASGGTYDLESDLDHLEVHYSYDPNFSPISGVGSATYLGKLIANAGMMAAGIAAVGTFQVTNTSGIYIKVIGVDESGNKSIPSSSSGVTATLIDDSHISSLSVSKLIAGTISAAIILGGTIATAASGQRVQMDSSGIHSYNSSGALNFDLNAGTAVITLGSSGSKSITLDTSTSYPTMYYNVGTSSGGNKAAFINGVGMTNTSDSSETAALGINTGQFYNGTVNVLHRIFLNDGGIGLFQQIDASQNATGGYHSIDSSTATIGVAHQSGDDTNTATYIKLDGSNTHMNGQFSLPSSNTESANGWTYTGFFSGTSGAGTVATSIGFGFTMASSMVVLVSSSIHGGSANGYSFVTSEGSTGFTLDITINTGTGYVGYYHAVRVS